MQVQTFGREAGSGRGPCVLFLPTNEEERAAVSANFPGVNGEVCLDLPLYDAARQFFLGFTGVRRKDMPLGPGGLPGLCLATPKAEAIRLLTDWALSPTARCVTHPASLRRLRRVPGWSSKRLNDGAGEGLAVTGDGGVLLPGGALMNSESWAVYPGGRRKYVTPWEPTAKGIDGHWLWHLWRAGLFPLSNGRTR